MSNDGELDTTLVAGDDTVPSVGPSEPASRSGVASGYVEGVVLGRGGMGEALLARDEKFGRDVALKRMRGGQPTAEAIARFRREAMIQAQLDHPAIVPIHDIGEDSEGRPFFTMKRLSGTTLHELLATGTATQQRMLRALVDVCLAIELAHERRFVHRDLKPSNIMLGDYGEVYVLDWGVARILRDEAQRMSATKLPSSVDQPAVDATQLGRMLGTPGYMAPEQARGDEVGTAADVFALGAILFEILAGTPLHARGSALAFVALDGDDISPAVRAPDRNVPPELDEACRAALAPEARDRPTARGLSDRIQSYLDGDRDIEARHKLATRRLASARAALESGDRATAVNQVGQAVALDASSREAVELMTALIVEPPRELPPEVASTVHDAEIRMSRERSRRAIWPFLSLFALTPMIPLFGVASWLELVLIYVATTLMMATSSVNWRVAAVPLWLFLSVQLVSVTMFSRIASPFLMTPTLLAAMLLGATSIPWLIDRRWAVLVVSLAGLLVPLALEAAGVFGDTWWFTDGVGLTTTSTVFEATGTINMLGTVIGSIAMVVLVSQYALGIARDRREALRALQIQAWHLKQLLPREGKRPTIDPDGPAKRVAA
jgi:serine/threonine-protein kinase